MSVQFANNAHSTLASGINDSATSITVASGHGARFPTLTGSQFFFATLIDTSNNLEIVKCTARSTDVLTVTRAQESTSAQAFSSGDRIELRVTAAGLAAVQLTDGDKGDITVASSGASWTIDDNAVDSDTIAANAVTAAKFNADVISGQTELAAEPADTDEFLVSDAGVLKRIDYSLIKGGGGKVLQSFASQIARATGTTGIPDDNTIPTSSEGTQIYSQAITPAATSSKVLLFYALQVYISVGSAVVITAFRGSTCIGASTFETPTGSNNMINSFVTIDSPSTTSATTYTLRIGEKTDTGTWVVGGKNNAVYGDILAKNTVVLQEIGA